MKGPTLVVLFGLVIFPLLYFEAESALIGGVQLWNCGQLWNMSHNCPYLEPGKDEECSPWAGVSKGS